MNEDQKEYFSNKENCFHEICSARKAFNKKTTFIQFESLIKGLLIMSLYCHEEAESAVNSIIDEAIERQSFSVGVV